MQEPKDPSELPPLIAENKGFGIKAENPMVVTFPDKALPAFELSDPQDMEIEILTIGKNKNRVLSIGNFFRNPEETRKYAASLDFAPEQLAISGVRSNIDPARQHMIDHVVEFAARLVLSRLLGLEGRPIRLLADKQLYGGFTVSILDRAAARRIKASADAGSDEHEKMLEIGAPHVDDHWYNLLVHLTLPGKEPGGTAIYRHRATGLESFFMMDPITAMRLEEAHKQDFYTKMLEAMRGRDEITIDTAYGSVRGILDIEHWFRAEDNPEWECIGKLPGEYNKAYLFPSWLWHAEYIENDRLDLSSFANARLTFNQFIGPHAVDDE